MNWSRGSNPRTIGTIGSREHPQERGVDVWSEHVGAAQDRGRDVGVALRELAHRLLGLHDVALEPGAWRVRAPHLLREEGGVVLLGAVVVGGALEDELAHRRVGAGARGQDVHRADDVVLVRESRRGHQRVDDQPCVDDRVDLGGAHDALAAASAGLRPSRTPSARARASGASLSTPMIASMCSKLSRACARRPPQYVDRPVTRTRRLAVCSGAGSGLNPAIPTSASRASRAGSPGSSPGSPGRGSVPAPCPRPPPRRPARRCRWAPGSGS